MEEFSFPEVAAEQDALRQLSFPHFASSPLWFPSPSSSSHKYATLDHHYHQQRRKSFSSVEDLKRQDKKSLTEVKDEERMDMLWEDFNEELHQNPCHGRRGRKGLDWSEASTKLEAKRHGVRDLLCPKAVPHRRTGLMMILKVLKTLLLIQKIRKTRKRSTYDSNQPHM